MECGFYVLDHVFITHYCCLRGCFVLRLMDTASTGSGKVFNQPQHGTPGVELGFPWLDYVFLRVNVVYAAMVDSMEEGVLTKLNTRCLVLILVSSFLCVALHSQVACSQVVGRSRAIS